MGRRSVPGWCLHMLKISNHVADHLIVAFCLSCDFIGLDQISFIATLDVLRACSVCLSFAPLVPSSLFHAARVYPDALGGSGRIALRVDCVLSSEVTSSASADPRAALERLRMQQPSVAASSKCARWSPLQQGVQERDGKTNRNYTVVYYTLIAQTPSRLYTPHRVWWG